MLLEVVLVGPPFVWKRLTKMEKTELLKKVVNVIQENDDLDCPIAAENISLESKFQDDLQFDSLARMSLVYELQETYPDLDETEIDNWNTIGDLVNKLMEYAT